MTRKSAPHSLLRTFSLIAVLLCVSAVVASTGTARATQTSGNLPTVSATVNAATASPSEFGTLPIAASGEHAPMARSRTQHRSAGAAPLFLPAVTYDSGGTGTNAIAVADVNGDGNPDLIVANNVGNVGVLLGNGD